MTTKTKTSNITESAFLEGMRKSCQLAAQILKEAGTLVKPGVKTIEINDFVHEKTLAAGAYPAPLNYPFAPTNPRHPKITKGGFPKSVCTSINDVVCHGIPGDDVLKEGDIVNIDVTTILDGYFGDTSATFMVGQVDSQIKKLVEVTYKCLELGIAAIVPGGRTIDIARAITNYAEPLGYSVVRDYTGHGVGRIFHTKPTICHYPSPETDTAILPGMFFTVEPMINLGTYHTVLDEKDHWTVRTRDGKPSAQFEHTLYIGPMGAEVLTLA